MRRLGAGLVSLLLAAGLGAGAGAARGEATVTVPWALVDTGPGARSLVVRYSRGGCDGVVSAVATGNASAIRIRLTRPDPTAGPPRACPQYIAILTLPVKLRHPVGGRRILGGSRAEPVPSPPGGGRVPRVLGLAPGDARGVLAAAGLGSTSTARKRTVRLPQVVGQSPGAHAAMGAHKTVRLRLSGTR